MEDTSFIDLLREENLSRINIDPRLIDAFKNVMKNIQLYFNEKGYSSEREYAIMVLSKSGRSHKRKAVFRVI